MDCEHRLTGILPCNNLDTSEAFYKRLGFRLPEDRPANSLDDGYRILSDGKGGHLHLTKCGGGMVDSGTESFRSVSLHRKRR